MEYRILSGIRQGFPSVRAQAGHRSHLPANKARLPGASASMASSSRARSPLILGSSVASKARRSPGNSRSLVKTSFRA